MKTQIYAAPAVKGLIYFYQISIIKRSANVALMLGTVYNSGPTIK